MSGGQLEVGFLGLDATYATIVEDAAARAPQQEALIFPDARLTYEQLLENATWRARELQALGVKRGDRVGILMPNAPEIVEFLIGCALLGAALVPISTRFKARELRHLIADAELAALVTTDIVDEHVNFKSLLYEALPGLEDAGGAGEVRVADAPFLRGLALVGERGAPGFVDGVTLRRLAAAHPIPTERPKPEEPALILYTSGTTAHPKGCVLSHRAIVLDARAIAERFAIPPDDRWWNPLPMFHVGGLMLMSAVFTARATYVTMPRFDADAAIDMIEREQPTVLYPLFPPITLPLMRHPRFGRLDRSRMRAVASVAPPDVQRQIQAAFEPAVLMNVYGITELCGLVVYSRLDDALETRIDTCGHPLPGFELLVVHPDNGEPLPPGARGELIGRGPSRFDGYYNNPEETSRVVDPDGYFHTGDLCSIGEDGRVTFHGRLKDMIKVGGENVAALEIESYLSTHPAVRIAQVVGVPDDRLVEVPAAVVELLPGAALTEEELIAYCRGAIASFKVPRYVRFVDEWPMSATKIQKFKLREDLVRDLGLQAAVR
jgi:fatty-acyl-CoA synthase